MSLALYKLPMGKSDTGKIMRFIVMDGSAVTWRKLKEFEMGGGGGVGDLQIVDDNHNMTMTHEIIT